MNCIVKNDGNDKVYVNDFLNIFTYKIFSNTTGNLSNVIRGEAVVTNGPSGEQAGITASAAAGQGTPMLQEAKAAKVPVTGGTLSLKASTLLEGGQ